MSTAETRRCTSLESSRPSFWKICVVCASTVRSVMKSVRAIEEFDRPSAICESTSRSRPVSSGSGSGLRLRAHRLGDDGRVDDALPIDQPAHRVEQDRTFEDPLLEQIAHASRICLDEAHRIVGLDILRQHQRGRLRRGRLDLEGGDQPFVGVCRRHPDVEDGHVRPMHADGRHRLGRVASLRDDVAAHLAQDSDDPGPREHRVVGDDYPHGSTNSSPASRAWR